MSRWPPRLRGIPAQAPSARERIAQALIEVLCTVQVSFRENALVPEPFAPVALIAPAAPR